VVSPAGSGVVVLPEAPTPAPLAPQEVADLLGPFRFDPVADPALMGAAGTIAFLSQLITGTGELSAQPPAVDSRRLSGLDRLALNHGVWKPAPLLGGIGVGAALGFAVLDSAVTAKGAGLREGLTDGGLYTEAILLNIATANVVKLAVRRPRPRRYFSDDQALGTDDALSFYSLHTALTASVTATGAYLAFVRASERNTPRSRAKGWVILGVGTVLTGFVGYTRVRAHEHFPSDVMVGGIVGGAIGVLVPHWHRRVPIRAPDSALRPSSVGFGPGPGDRAGLSLVGQF
jgi:membrane-associated phospholipid phosphatase